MYLCCQRRQACKQFVLPLKGMKFHWCLASAWQRLPILSTPAGLSDVPHQLCLEVSDDCLYPGQMYSTFDPHWHICHLSSGKMLGKPELQQQRHMARTMLLASLRSQVHLGSEDRLTAYGSNDARCA